MSDLNNASSHAAIQYRKRLAEFQSNGNSLDERSQVALFAQCVELQVLKAPATAVFPDFDEMIVNGSNGRYSVSGFVDSQNSYGATIRSNFTYNIERAGDSWKCSNTFVDTTTVVSKNVQGTVIGSTVICWILGIIGTIITFFILNAFIFDDLF